MRLQSFPGRSRTEWLAVQCACSRSQADPWAEWSSRSMRGSRSQADSAPEWLAVQSAGSRSQADLWTEWCGVRRADGRSNSSGIHKNAGWSDEKIPSHLKGIDFNQPVEVVTLPKGTKVVQYQIPGNPTGNYFAPAGTSAESLGMNSAGRVATIYTVLRDVTVLRSTAANTAANPNLPASVRGAGGGLQYFAPDTSAFGKSP